MRSHHLPILALFALHLAACGASAPPPAAPGAPIDPPRANSDLMAMMDESAGSEPSAEDKKKAADQQKLDEDFAKLERDMAAEKTRFDDKLRKELIALGDKNFPSLKSALDAIMKSPHRSPGASDRDKERHPGKMLEFFGLRSDQAVLELDPGAGWYTEILAPLLHKKGKLSVTGADPNGPLSERSTYYGKRLRGLLDKAPELGDKVSYIVTPSGPLSFDASLSDQFDLVLAFRNLHNWTRRGQLDQNLAQVFKVLKPGGALAVEAHRTKAAPDPKASAEKGYLPEAFVIERAQAAGFVLDKKSEINANPQDTADHPDGVWSLPPTLRGGDKDREKFTAIGESDRMTLRFVKPKPKAAR